MSISFSFSDVAQSTIDSATFMQDLEVMGFNCKFIGINEITEDNYRKVYQRYLMHNYDSATDPEKLYVTLDLVKSFIGLKTFTTELDDAEFRALTIERLERFCQVQAGIDL